MENNIIADLEKYLDEYDLVILIDIDEAILVTNMLCSSKALEKTSKKVVIISTVTFSLDGGNHTFRYVTEEEMSVILEVYRSYEASDHLILVSDSGIYGEPWNYIDNGMLTFEEMFTALLT